MESNYADEQTSKMNQVQLIDVDANHPDLHDLIEKLDKYLFELYPPEEIFLVDFEEPSIDKVDFTIAYLHGKPVGCGAIKPLDAKTVELKRFFVVEEHRNQGVAARILRHLEEKAKKNYKAMRLETGDQQTEAIGFYKKHGYYEIDRFGEYIDCPSSVCMEKKMR